MKHIAVIDIGKTNAKLALVDTVARAEISVITRANTVRTGPPYPHFDVDGIWDFIQIGLAQFQQDFGIDGISVTTHGATAALLTKGGALAAPILDYEHAGPDSCRAEYDALRPPFDQTGSPPLPLGLNLGAQLFWQFRQDPGLLARVETVVTYPQYWGYLLTGVRACDVTSLGCHTDFWLPKIGTYSSLPAQLGLADRFAPALTPDAVLGPILPQLQAALGVGPVPVLCGIHDSNASLLPHLLGRDAPFSVVSTGTWVISMAIGGQEIPLNPAQDTLINVSALGLPVPSARFMGGRIFDDINAGRAPVATTADAAQVLEKGLFLLPVGQGAAWAQPAQTHAQAEVALGYFLAMMTADCLDRIGAKGPVIIEGPFSANPWFVQMLAAATGRAVIAAASRTGTAVGAALLFNPQMQGQTPEMAVQPDPVLAQYAHKWRASR